MLGNNFSNLVCASDIDWLPGFGTITTFYCAGIIIRLWVAAIIVQLFLTWEKIIKSREQNLTMKAQIRWDRLLLIITGYGRKTL